MRFFASLATEYDEVYSGYQPGQIFEVCKNQRFEDHLCLSPQDISLVMVGKKHSEDEDRDRLRNVGFFTAQPLDPADSPRKLHQFLHDVSRQHVEILK
jgi:hypothetical protein